MSDTTAASARATQAERRSRSRAALLLAAARQLSHGGYSRLNLDEVAADAGYTRGAIYHQFKGKEDLVLAVVEWIDRTWHEQVLAPAAHAHDPEAILVAAARGHIRYCRQDVARVMMSLRVEFAGQEHPIGAAVTTITDRLVSQARELIDYGRQTGQLPAGRSSASLASALIGAIEGTATQLGPENPDDQDLAEAIVRGLLRLSAPHDD